MQQLNIKESKKPWYKKWWGVTLLVIFGLPAAIVMLALVAGMIGGVTDSVNEKRSTSQTTTTPEPQKKRDPETLNIQVSHDNVNITFASSEAKDLGNCRFKLNDKYVYSTPNRYFLNAGDTTKVGFSNFTLDDGTRFNAFATKPKYLTVTCDRKDGDGGTADIFWD